MLPGLAAGSAWCLAAAVLTSTDLWQPQYIATWWLSGAVLGCVLALRRRAPVVACVLAFALYPLAYRVGLQSDLHAVPVLLATFFVVRAGAARWWVAAALGSAAVVALLTPGGLDAGGGWRYNPAPIGFSGDFSRAAWLAGTVAAVAYLAWTIARLDRTTQELRGRNVELVDLRAEHARDEVARERVRIARDLHDVVAHHIAAILMRAQAAEHVAATNPSLSAEIVPWIAHTSREALAATRAVVEVLVDGDPDSAAPRTPADGEEALSAVMARVRGAGLDVRADMPAQWPALPPLAQLAVVRIAQESLTNVLVHSHASTVDVSLRLAGPHVQFEVNDPGPVRVGTSSSGHGLVNMRERARTASGTLHAGPCGQGWRVVLTVPTHVPSDEHRDS